MKLFSSRKPAGPDRLQGMQISTAVNTLPVPICYGTPRVGSNLVWMNGFQAIPQQASGGGGKGLLSGGKGQTTGYTYIADIILQICEGVVTQPYIKYLDGTGWPFAESFNSNGLVVSNFLFYEGGQPKPLTPRLLTYIRTKPYSTNKPLGFSDSVINSTQAPRFHKLILSWRDLRLLRVR
jgi:hypothetical protein